MKLDKDVLFLAGLFPKELENEILEESIGNIQNAANIFQWNLVNGFDENLVKPIKILNLLYIGSYPLRYKKMFIKSKKFKHSNDSEDFNVGFINMMGLKFVFRWISIKPYLKKWALDNKENKVVYAYALTNNNMKAFKYLKKINKNITTCIIVPDLPEYMNTTNKKSIIYAFLKKIDIKLINSKLRYSDQFVLLTEIMKNKLSIGNKKYCVVEGIASSSNNVKRNRDSKEKIIMYTGTLNEKYGVRILIEAFRKIKDMNYRLIICGDGDSRDYILNKCLYDNRIIFKGLIKREEVVRLQKQATVLVNPRQNNEEYCKYSFPSKIMEYLAAGIPVIAYKLDGIPDDYDKYLIYPKSNKIEDLTKEIIKVCELKDEYRSEIGRGYQKFIENEKSSRKQCERILEMLGDK